MVDILGLDDREYHLQCQWATFNASGIEGSIHDCQVQKYQPSLTSRLIFQYSMIIKEIKWWNITLDVTDGWNFRTGWLSMSPSMSMTLSNWVCSFSFDLISFGSGTSLKEKKYYKAKQYLKFRLLFLSPLDYQNVHKWSKVMASNFVCLNCSHKF